MAASLVDNNGIIRCALTYSIASMIKKMYVEYACDHEIAAHDITTQCSYTTPLQMYGVHYRNVQEIGLCFECNTRIWRYEMSFIDEGNMEYYTDEQGALLF
jgi:hypothetical protein